MACSFRITYGDGNNNASVVRAQLYTIDDKLRVIRAQLCTMCAQLRRINDKLRVMHAQLRTMRAQLRRINDKLCVMRAQLCCGVKCFMSDRGHYLSGHLVGV